MPDPCKERQYAKLLLSTLSLSPDTLEVADKPDIRMEINGSRIGLEVTEATPEEYRRAKKALRDSGWRECIFTESWQHRTERRATDELMSEGIDLHGPWVDSLDSFQNWASRIEERLRDKQRAFSHTDFQRFDENWLLVVDLDHSMITHEPDLLEGRSFFHELLSTFQPKEFFDRTFILMSNAGLIDWNHRQNEITWKVTADLIFRICPGSNPSSTLS